MIKKQYMAPTVEIIDVKINQQLLIGSVSIDSTPIDAGEVEAPEMPGMPDIPGMPSLPGMGGFPFE